MITLGTSPKARLAAILPALAALAATGVQWAVTGAYDQAELVTTLTGLTAAAIAYLGAYLGAPGTVIANIGPASDGELPPDVHKRLSQT